MQEYSVDAVTAAFSRQRMAPYLDQCGGDLDNALELYAWSAQMSAALFELIAHLEVAVRNSIDRALTNHFGDEAVGIPWFLRRPPMTDNAIDQIEYVREKLRARGRENRHQIIANLNFGFWSGLLGSEYEDLWRSCLHHAFPLSGGRRKTVGPTLEAI